MNLRRRLYSNHLMGSIQNARLKRYLISLSAKRHWCTLVSSKNRKVPFDFAVFIYLWTVTAQNIIAARYSVTNAEASTDGKKRNSAARTRLGKSTLIHISYKSLNTKSLEPRVSNGFRFANEWKLDWGKVMKWENIFQRHRNEPGTKYEFFLPEIISQDDMQERLNRLLGWTDKNPIPN